MSSQETSNENLDANTSNNTIANRPSRVNTLRKSASLKPRKSLLRVRSLRPTRAVLGKIRTEEE